MFHMVTSDKNVYHRNGGKLLNIESQIIIIKILSEKRKIRAFSIWNSMHHFKNKSSEISMLSLKYGKISWKGCLFVYLRSRPRKAGNRFKLSSKSQSYHVKGDPTTFFFPLELSFAIEIHGTGHSACTYTSFLSAVGCTPRNWTEISTSAGMCDI